MHDEWNWIADGILDEQRPPAPPPAPAAEELRSSGYGNALVAYERQLIETALQETGGNISEASRLLKISRNGLKRKIPAHTTFSG